MEQNYDLNSYRKPCPKVDCRKKACECGLDYVLIPAALEDVNPPKKGAYCNALVEYEQSGRIYVYSREGIPVEVKAGDLSKALADEIKARIDGDDALKEDLATEAGIRERADSTLEQEIENLKNNPDVVDIVDSYADLQAYDTSTLGDRDIVRVLTDETHDNESSYYRWDKPNSQWVFIGAVEGYYTKGQTDTLLSGKQNKLTAGANITIDPDTNEISAADTTYSNFVGTDGVDPGVAGLVPAPATTDAGKFLKADGTWDTAGGATNVVQTTGTSQMDVMSQNATTSMVYADPGTKTKVQIGSDAIATGNNSISLGNKSQATKSSSIGIGWQAKSNADGAIQIGYGTNSQKGSVGLGYTSTPSQQGEVNVGCTSISYGYNNSHYRLISGVYDGQSLHDAATVAQGNTLSSTAPTSSTAGVLGQLFTDTVNGVLYHCTAIDTTDPDNPSYTWDTVGGSGGSGVTELTSADYNYDDGNTGTNNTVGLWLLDDGVYVSKGAVKAGTTVSSIMNDTTGYIWIVNHISGGNSKIFQISDGGRIIYYTVVTATGAMNNHIYELNRGDIVGNTGNSNTDVMSQKATTELVYPVYNNKRIIRIGTDANAGANDAIAIGGNGGVSGNGANATSSGAIAIGAATDATQNGSIALGRNAQSTAENAIAIGLGAQATQQGQMDIGLPLASGHGYNNSDYRLLTGVYDPQNAHDAATKGYVDGMITLTDTDPGEGSPLAAGKFIAVYTP